MSRDHRIVPAVLTDKTDELASLLRASETFADYVQIDFMDGKFVPSFSILAEDVLESRPRLKWEAHIMVIDPANQLEKYYNAGASKLIFHTETKDNPTEVIHGCRQLGMGVGMAVNPGTPASTYTSYIPLLDSILFMAVIPGFYGAHFIPEVLDEVRKIRLEYPTLHIGLDGGVKADNVELIASCGVDDICVGSAIFREKDPGEAFRNLQARVNVNESR
ncbi:ribulose-phosphate 3-epimerase [Chloroflexota bacterium]